MNDDEIRKLAEARLLSSRQGDAIMAQREQEKARFLQQREADRVAHLIETYRKCTELGDRFREWARREKFGTNWSENLFKFRSGWIINSNTFYMPELNDAVGYSDRNPVTDVLVLLKRGGIYSSKTRQKITPNYFIWFSTLDQLWLDTYDEMVKRVVRYVAHSRGGPDSWPISPDSVPKQVGDTMLTKFFVELPSDERGNTYMRKAVVEVKLTERDGYETLVPVAPEYFVDFWRFGWRRNNYAGWVEVDGPARMLSQREYDEIINSLSDEAKAAAKS